MLRRRRKWAPFTSGFSSPWARRFDRALHLYLERPGRRPFVFRKVFEADSQPQRARWLLLNHVSHDRFVGGYAELLQKLPHLVVRARNHGLAFRIRSLNPGVKICSYNLSASFPIAVVT